MELGKKLIVTLAAACLMLAAMPARAEPPKDATPSVDEICRTLAQAAADNDLPEEFFTRLIWQESRFDPKAVSPMGAQGIAQFMPATAAMRGLVNAFEPLQALRESASYLSELRTTFHGNLGLAAAAYNAGPAAVESLARPPRLPALRDAGLCPHRHRLYRGGVDRQADAAARVLPARADRRALRRAGEGPARERAPPPAALVQPRLGTMGRPAGRQLVRRQCARRLRTAAAQIPVDPGRPAAAGHEQPPAPRRTSFASRKRPAPMPMLSVRSCTPPAAPASSCATRATDRPMC